METKCTPNPFALRKQLRDASALSYRKHCGPRAVECAEGNLLGDLLAACQTVSNCLRLLPPVFEVVQAQGELVVMCKRALREIQAVLAKATDADEEVTA